MYPIAIVCITEMISVQPAIGVVVIGIAVGVEVLCSIFRLVKSATVANSLPPLRRFCVARALCRGDGPRHSLHVSAQYCGYNEDFLF